MKYFDAFSGYGGRKKATSPPKKELETLHHKEWMTYEEIAKHYKVGKKIVQRWFKEKMTYDEVEAFASEELKTIIHLGKSYSPFQYGIRRKDFITLEKVTCPAMELIVKCYQENISNYYKVLEAMKSLTK